MTQIIEKNINQITFLFCWRRPGRGSEDIKKEYNVNCFDIFFSLFWWMSWVEKSQSAQKNCTKIEQEETHAHRKRARGALSRERTLELRQRCATSRECSVRLDKWIVVKRTVTKRDTTTLISCTIYHIRMYTTVAALWINCIRTPVPTITEWTGAAGVSL